MTTALVVSEEGSCPGELTGALRADGFDVRHATLLHALADNDLRPDLVLASASLGLRQVGRLSSSYAAATTVVYPEDDYTALESCVRGGFDYVVPPFLPALVRSRMASCRERGRLAVAVEEMAAAASLREYERDLSIARDIQSGFLPSVLPAPSGWEFASRFRPARQVAGDFYDGFELVHGHRLGFLVADVCDKGVGAALFMALIRTLLRHTAEHTGGWERMDGMAELGPLLSLGAGPLVQSVVGTNRYLARNHLEQGYFCTVFFGVLDPTTGGLLYINGGHNPPVLLRADGTHEMLRPTGPAVGMRSDSAYLLGHNTVEPGDTLLVYTDGVVEARSASGAMFGMDRLLDVVGPRSAEGLLDDIDHALHTFVGGADQSDDITMVALHRT